MSTATVELPCDRAAAHRARRWVMEQHLRWGFAGRGALQHLFDDLVLCVSELVTTAVEAGSSSIALTLDNTASVVRLVMTDRSPDSSVAAHIRSSGNGHRARIIDAVASRWGVEPEPAANEIWLEFDLTRPTAGVVAGR
jgi:hypothetical protein